MGHSQADKAASRARILKIAARRLREGGPQALNVASLMQAAGLTHGGFYGHFASREALLEEALVAAMAEGDARAARSAERRGEVSAKASADSYLSLAHRDNPGGGCAYAALAADVARADAPLRGAFTAGLAAVLDRMEITYGGRSQALAAMSTLLGALVLSRAVDDEALSQEILAATRSQF